MKRVLIVGLCLACILITACADAGGEREAPPEDPAPAADNADVMPEPPANDPPGNENDNGNQGDQATVPEPEEAEAMVFDEDEGMVVNVIDAPPEGRYSVTHHQGTTNCPNVGVIEIPALPPEEMDLSLSEDLYTMTLYTNEGSIELGYSESISPSGEVTEAWEGVITVTGSDILYQVYYNVFGEGEINGLISNEEQGCETNRGFTAVRIGP